MADAGPLRRARAWFFDLDGTLLDSLPGIEHSARAAFAACGLAMGEVELRTLIGPPIRTILAKMALADAAGGMSEDGKPPPNRERSASEKAPAQNRSKARQSRTSAIRRSHASKKENPPEDRRR